MLGCLADEHISYALVHALRRAGVDVATVQEQGLAATDDSLIEEAARGERRLVLTNDTDYLRIAAAPVEGQACGANCLLAAARSAEDQGSSVQNTAVGVTSRL